MSKPGSYAILDTGNAYATGLLHYWPLNEGSGTTAADLGSGASPGTMEDLAGTAAAFWGTESFGAVAACDGAHRINLGTPSFPAVGTYYVRFRTPNGFVQPLLANRQPGGGTVQGFLSFLYYGQFYWQEPEAGGATSLNTSATGFNDDAWHELICVTTAGGTAVYLDSNTPVAVVGGSLIHVGRAIQAYLGYGTDTGTYALTGALDQALVWDHAFTDSDVAGFRADPYQLLVTGAPLAPGTLTAVSHTSILAKFTWTNATGGAGSSTAKLQQSPHGAGTWTDTGEISSPARVVGLTPSGDYDFRVEYDDGVSTPVHSNIVEVVMDPELVPEPLYLDATSLARWQSIWAGSTWEKTFLADAAANEVTGYSQTGEANGLLYLITGDAAYAATAWDTLVAAGYFVPNPDTITRNGVRGRYLDMFIMYTWLYAWMDAGKRSQFQTYLLDWAEWTMGNPPFAPSGDFVSLGDSDQLAAQYVGLALTDAYFGTDYLEGTTYTYHHPIGGLDATAADFSTVRNCIAAYCARSTGGTWLVGSQYNTEDPHMLLMYAAALKFVYGRAIIPEIEALLPDLGLHLLHEMTPDLMTLPKWGDDETNISAEPQGRITEYMVIAGMAGVAGLSVAPLLQAMTKDLHALAGTSADPTSLWKRPFTVAWALLWWDPAAPAATDWRAEMPHTYQASGMGETMVRHGDDAQAAQIFLHGGNPTGAQHESTITGDVQLYRKGEWVFAHPVAYFASGWGVGELYNTFLHAGLPIMRGDWGTRAQEAGSGYALIRCGADGQFYELGHYDPPAAFVTEYNRTLFYLEGTTLGSETILVFSRVRSVPPPSVYGYPDRYGADELSLIERLPLKLEQFHANFAAAAPVISGGAFTWDTPGGQHCQIATLLPSGATQAIINDNDRGDPAWNGPSGQVVADNLHGYTLHVSPAVDTAFATFLHALQVYDTGVTLNSTLVQSGSGEAQGAHVQRTGESDCLVLFGAQSAGRLLSSSFSVTFNPVTASSKVYLSDLDPGQSWALTDNGASVPLTVSSAGVGTATLSGAGGRTLALSAGAGGGGGGGSIVFRRRHGRVGSRVAWN